SYTDTSLPSAFPGGRREVRISPFPTGTSKCSQQLEGIPSGIDRSADLSPPHPCRDFHPRVLPSLRPQLPTESSSVDAPDPRFRLPDPCDPAAQRRPRPRGETRAYR